MNKQTIILLLTLLLFLIPTGAAIHAYSVDKFERLGNEGAVAYTVAYLDSKTAQNGPETPPAPNPAPVQTTCNKCKGTKLVRSPDNVTDLPCPCGGACKCVKTKGDPPEVKTPQKQIFLVTSPTWCMPCVQIDYYTKPALVDGKWSFGENGQIVELSGDDETILDKYGVDRVPTWILMVDGKEVDKYKGFLNDWGVLHFYNREKLTDTDKVVKIYPNLKYGKK